jgi:hypothetical protein
MLQSVTVRPEPGAWAQEVQQRMTRDIAAAQPWLTARIELAARFGLSQKEALTLDMNLADRGHCLVVDIRSHYTRSQPRFLFLEHTQDRVALASIASRFNTIDCGPGGFGEVAGDTSANRNIGAGASYVNGPLNVQFAYRKANTVAVGGVTGDERATLIGGTYDFGVAKAHIGFADNKLPSATGDGKDRNYLPGVSAPVGGAGTVLASWTRNDVRDVSAGKSDQYALGYTYALSKRTNLYTSYSYTKNDDSVALNTYNTSINGANVKAFNAGVRRQF